MTTDQIIALSGLLTAIAAMAATAWQAALGREHNRRSVRPIVRVDVSIARNAPFKGLVIRNIGLGPAVIESFDISVRGRGMKGTVGGWGAARDALAIPAGRLDVGWLTPGDVLGHGEVIHAFGLNEQFSQDDSELKRFLRGLKDVTLEIRYKSVYEEQFIYKFNGRKSGQDYDGYLPEEQ